MDSNTPRTIPRKSHTFDDYTLSEIRRAAQTGIYDIRGAGAKRKVPHFDDLLFLGASISRYPLEGYREKCGTDVILGNRFAKKPIHLKIPVTIAGMSFGALSGQAVEAMNRGASLAGCLHNTGEGGLAEQHLHGADLIFQIGTAYFGCRDPQGRFSHDQLKETFARGPVRAIEIKLSQGAKPGLGGLVPAAKMTPEIARVRGVEPWKDCHSPPHHTAFRDVDSLLDFVELLAAETGLPVGIKSAVGDRGFWRELAELTATTGRGVDHITIDGGEGGTGAAPLAFADHVSLPFKLAFARAYTAFARRGIQDDVVWIGSAKLGLPDASMFAFALGCDMVNVGREAMMAVGCIQAQRCHTGHCPTGVATQTPRLTRGLVPDDKAPRVASYVRSLRGEVLALSRSMGKPHPSLVEPDQLRLLTDDFAGRPVEEVFGYAHKWRQLSPERRAEVEQVARAAGMIAEAAPGPAAA